MKKKKSKKSTIIKALALLLAVVAVFVVLYIVNHEDPLELIAEERAAIEQEYATVLAEYDGGTVSKFDVMATVGGDYNSMSQMAAMFGMEMDDATMNRIIEVAVQGEVQKRAIAKEFEARGLTIEVTEEELQAQADEYYKEYYDYCLEYAQSESEEANAAYAEMMMYSQGYTPEFLVNYLRSDYQRLALQQAVLAEITELTEEELQAAYEAKVLADEETYTANPSAIEALLTTEDGYVCWLPEGYRTVKHVLIIPEEAQLTAVADARAALETAKAEMAALEDELHALTDDDQPEVEVEPEAEAAAETEIEAAAETEAEVVADTEAETEVAAETEPEVASETEPEAAVDTEAEAATETEPEAAAETEAEAANDTAPEVAAETEPEAAADEPASDERTAEVIQAEIDAKAAEIAELTAAVEQAEADCLASVQSDLDLIYEKLEEGKSFAAVMEVFGEDPGMTREPSKTTGYYVSADSITWDPAFTAGAMTLENIGDYSAEPVISSSGVHVISYFSDVASGPVALEEVREGLYEDALAERKSAHYQETLTALVEALNPVYHLESWQF